ncbi:MAG: LemA family protein, partial [Candidatus Micrarchaeota archaeon]
SGIESKIAYSRQFYNDSVLEYNASIQQFPTSFFAKRLHFEAENYAEFEAASKENIKVKF